MPIHPHDGAERLEPERVGDAPQQLVAPVVMNDRLANHRAEAAHSLRGPLRHLSAMERQIGASSPSSLHHFSQLQPFRSFEPLAACPKARRSRY